MLQAAGDLGLEQEPGAADRVVGVAVEDLLQRHLAVQLGVEGDEDLAQAALGVGPEDAEPLAVGGGRADRVSWRLFVWLTDWLDLSGLATIGDRSCGSRQPTLGKQCFAGSVDHLGELWESRAVLIEPGASPPRRR